MYKAEEFKPAVIFLKHTPCISDTMERTDGGCTAATF